MSEGHFDEAKRCTLFSLFCTLYKSYKTKVFLFFILSSFVGLHSLINSYLIKVIIDSLENVETSVLTMGTILIPGFCILFNFEVNNLSWRGINYITLKVVPNIKNNLISNVFNNVHQQSTHFFQSRLSGTLTSNIILLSDNIERISLKISPRLIRGTTHICVAFLGMYSVHILFLTVLAIWTLFFIFLSFMYSERIRSLSDESVKSQSKVSGLIVDSITNFMNVKVFAQFQYEVSLLSKALTLVKHKFQLKEFFLLKFYFFQGLSVTFLMGCIIYLLISLRIDGLVTIGDFAFILGAVFCVTENVWDFAEQIDQLNEAVGKCQQSLRALPAYLNTKDIDNAKKLIVDKGEIIFKKVSFHYQDDDLLFKDLSINISPLQKVGLVGLSGSGKSSFVKLLLRLYDVKEGEILIDGQNIRHLSQESLRQAISLVPQDSILFHRSILDNIRYGNLFADKESIVLAAQKANAHDFICRLPGQYLSFVGEGGVKLSSGQRQRIMIARAFLKKAPLLVFDEMTSQLDSITEKRIQKSLITLMEKKTALVVAHRLSTLLEMDRILVFDHGRIIEDGTHQDLLAQKGLYNQLWSAQIDGLLPLSGKRKNRASR